MANNCLLEKYVGVVSNNNLHGINEFFIDVKPRSGSVTNYFQFSFYSYTPNTEKVTFTVIGNGGIATSSAGLDNPLTTISISKDNSVHSIFCSNGDYRIKVTGKYYIGETLKINPNGANNGLCIINLEDIAYCEYITTLYLLNTDSYGDISNLGKLTALATFYGGTSKISGTIESFVQAQRAAGRTSTSSAITFSASSTQVTFDGGPLESSTLSWTASTITLGSKTIDA